MNIVSLFLRNNLTIQNKIEQVKAQKDLLAISGITYFDIKRGLLAVKATKQLENFNELCQDYQIILLDDLAILEKAAKIH